MGGKGVGEPRRELSFPFLTFNEFDGKIGAGLCRVDPTTEDRPHHSVAQGHRKLDKLPSSELLNVESLH